MIKRLIFDVDGTLITGVDFISTIQATLRKLGSYSLEREKQFLKAISLYENEYNNYNKKDYIEFFGKHMELDLNENFLEIFFEELKTCVPNQNEKLRNTLKELANHYELVLLTNYFKESQLNRLNTMGIGEFFSECYGEELIKPNDEIYMKACGAHKPQECVMIGDDLKLDIQKSLELGLHAIFVNSKKKCTENLNGNIVNCVEEITTKMIEELDTSYSK